MLVILGYFGYTYWQRRVEQRERDSEPTPFMFGGARAAVDLLAEMPGGAADAEQQPNRPPRTRGGRRRNAATDEKVDLYVQTEAKEESTITPVFFAPQLLTRRPVDALPGQQYPLVQTSMGKEIDPFEAMDEASPNTPATKRSRPPPAPINSGLEPPADAPGGGLTAGLPFTPLPQYPTSARAHSDEGNTRTRHAHPPVSGQSRRFKLRVVNAGNKSRTSSQHTHSTKPSTSGSISKNRPTTGSSTGSGVYEPPTYTRPPSYANSHASNSRSHPEMPPLSTLLDLIGASGGEDGAIIHSPSSMVSGGPALRDSGLFSSGVSTGDYKGHHSRKSYASTRRSLASIQDVQAVPGPSSQPMTPPVPTFPLGAAPLMSSSTFMMHDPLPNSRRVSASSSRRHSKRAVRTKAQPARSASTAAAATPSSSAPSSAHPGRTSMGSEMDITSIRALGASPDGASSSRTTTHGPQPSLDAKSARSVDVTSLYHKFKGKISHRDSSGSSDGVPAIPPLPDQTPFDFDLGFGGLAQRSDAALKALQEEAASVASTSALSSPLTGATPFPMGSSAPTSAATYATERDPWGPSIARTASTSTTGHRVRRKPAPSEASFASFGSDIALLRGKERSDTIGST